MDKQGPNPVPQPPPNAANVEMVDLHGDEPMEVGAAAVPIVPVEQSMFYTPSYSNLFPVSSEINCIR